MTAKYKHQILKSTAPGFVFLFLMSISFLPVGTINTSSAEESLVRQRKDTSQSTYKIEVRPIDIIPLDKKTTGSSPSTHSGAATVDKPRHRRPASGQSKFKGMIKNQSSATAAGRIKPGASVNSSEKTITIKPLNDKPDRDKNRIYQSEGITAKPIGKPEGVEKKYEIKVSPATNINTQNGGTVKASPDSRIKVTGVRAWKLDESGNKTDEKIIDDNNVIEGINQSPLE